jgi:uncharacterized protein YraI
MRSLIIRISIALVLTGTAIVPGLHLTRAQSTDISIGDIVNIDTDGVNLRDTAGTSGDVITTLDTGIQLEIIDGPETADGYTWWMGVVQNEDSVDQGVSGWIVEDFLSVDDSQSPGDNTPTLSATSDTGMTPTPTSTPDGGEVTFENAGWVMVTDGPVNFRKNPGLNGAIVRQLVDGDTGTVVDPSELIERDDFTWINITARDGVRGWIATDFLEAHDTDPCADNGCEVGEHSDLLDAEAVAVVDGPVNVRAKGSITGTIVDTLPTGTILNTPVKVQIAHSGDYDWLKVDYQGEDAWVATDFIEPSDTTCEVSPCVADGSDSGVLLDGALGVRVIDGPLNVRDEAGLAGAIVDVLDTGAEAQVDTQAALTDADGYTWIRIAGPGLQGWVATDFVEPLDAVPCTDGACYPAELNPFFAASGVFVIDGPLNLRAAPGTNAGILMVLENGDYGVIESVIDTDPYEADGYLWIQITPAGTGVTGYVAIDFVEPAG